jgi:hypothetical protein
MSITYSYFGLQHDTYVAKKPTRERQKQTNRQVVFRPTNPTALVDAAIVSPFHCRLEVCPRGLSGQVLAETVFIIEEQRPAPRGYKTNQQPTVVNASTT